MLTTVPSARRVLNDVKLVLAKLEDEADYTEWRLFWVLAIVLLRTVGHVLIKVDGSSDSRVKKISHELYKIWKTDEENLIFSEFIEKERNNILKEYEVNMTEGPVPMQLSVILVNGTKTNENFFIEENIYRPIPDGVFAGEDGRTLLEEAVEWWQQQLDRIDRDLS